MNNREDDIQELCRQVLNATLEVNSDWEAFCPFCGNSGFNVLYVDEIKDIKHEPNCAYLIAKDLATKID